MHLLLLFLSFCCTYSLLGQQNSVRELDNAIRLYEQGKYPKAERIIDKLLKSTETNAQVYVWKSKLLIQFEEYGAAYEQLIVAQSIMPFNVALTVALGDLKFQVANLSISNPEVCGSCATEILPDIKQNLKPSDYFNAAVKDYLLALRIMPKDAPLHYKIALCYHFVGQQKLSCHHMQIAASFRHNQAVLFLFENQCVH